MSYYCAKKPSELPLSLCVELYNGEVRTPCPINHHIVMGRNLYDFFWETSQKEVCKAGQFGCEGNHNPMLCPKQRCRVCFKMGHWDLICPSADKYISCITQNGDSPSLVTKYTDDLFEIVTVRLVCSRNIFQVFFTVFEEEEEMDIDEFYQTCTHINCANCGKIGNTMVCQCAPKKKCLRCKRIHHIRLCPAMIPDKIKN